MPWGKPPAGRPDVCVISAARMRTLVLMRWFGYGCFAFADDNVRVVFDPHDGKSIGLFPPSTDADVVVATHNSYARTSFRSIRGNHIDLRPTVGDIDVDGFEAEGLKTDSIYDDKLNVVYRFEMDGVKVIVCGCIGAIPEAAVLEKMRGADLMVVPVGEFATMPMDKVNELLELTKPRIVVPCEFKAGGITLPLSTIQSFSEGRDAKSFTYMGAEIEFTSEDIEGYTGTWILDF